MFSDLPDGGSKHIAETVREIKKRWVDFWFNETQSD